jgi:elongator complex protein 5
LSVLVDSVDTLASDLGSATKTVALLVSVLQIVQERPAPSRLVLHINVSLLADHADVLSLLLQTSFSSSLIHVIAHPPVLLHHLATAYWTAPPPMTQPEKFWSVFTPFVERGPAFEAERLVFRADGEGCSGPDFIVELLVRGESGRDGRRGSRGVERSLEGWGAGQACSLQSLASLQSVFGRKVAHIQVCDSLVCKGLELMSTQPASDPTQDVTFNLNLTTQQQHERSQVPLPYAHEGSVCVDCYALSFNASQAIRNCSHPARSCTSQTPPTTSTRTIRMRTWIFKWCRDE